MSPTLIGGNRPLCTYVSIIELCLNLIDIDFFLPRRSTVFSAIRRNWYWVSSHWQMAVDYRVCPSLITADLLIRAGVYFGILKPCSEPYTESYYRPTALSTTSFVSEERQLGSLIFIAQNTGAIALLPVSRPLRTNCLICYCRLPIKFIFKNILRRSNGVLKIMLM